MDVGVYFTINTSDLLHKATVPAGTYNNYKVFLYALFCGMNNASTVYDTDNDFYDHWMLTIDEENNSLNIM